MPFRFGAVTLHQADLLTCRVHVRDEYGDQTIGWSSDLMMPRWFRKDTDATPQQDADELYAAAQAAAAAFVAQSEASPAFSIWRRVLAERIESQPRDQPDLLVRGFGVAIVERAMLDATSRLAQLPFAQALRQDCFGFRPGEVHAQLGEWAWQSDLPKPNPEVTVRHTVGMLDVLRAKDLDPLENVDDGLPQTLDQDIDTYGLNWFKVKVGAGVEKDRARLLDLAAFFAERDMSPGLSLDGNEQYQDLGELAAVLEAVHDDANGRQLLQRITCIEQPLARANTFAPERHRDLERVTRFAPLILDEADATPKSFVRALELGYRGVSVKNCKGVFRALCNFGVCRLASDRFQSGEDLTNVGVLPLQQDLVTASVLGLPHVERNGHHYFRGLDHLPADVVRGALAQHSDLYRSIPGGSGAALRIENGRVRMQSALDAIGYGHAFGGASHGDHGESLHVAAKA